MQYIEINLKRLEYLVELFGFSREYFVEKLQSFYKKSTFSEEDIFTNQINLNYLKKNR